MMKQGGATQIDTDKIWPTSKKAHTRRGQVRPFNLLVQAQDVSILKEHEWWGWEEVVDSC